MTILGTRIKKLLNKNKICFCSGPVSATRIIKHLLRTQYYHDYDYDSEGFITSQFQPSQPVSLCNIALFLLTSFHPTPLNKEVL